ncbi:hypothetical protein IQ06DRAFT_298658 [Phaeosphaeriaceae sp. SRC1lsM3a]|nr:hypothetical protein IQ06DRAFT_298658 [Stagonospora sp. SRC1lsM3a]
MRYSFIPALLSVFGATTVSAQNVGKFAICNNCVPTGSGAPVCTQNNYVHWGNEDEQGNCNDRTTVISGACSEGTIDSPLGSGEYQPTSDCDENAEPGTLTGSVIGLRSGGGGGVFKLDCFKEQDSFTDFCGATFACNIFLVCKPA